MNFSDSAKGSAVKRLPGSQASLPSGVSPRNRSVPFRIEGIEYKGEISLEQIIACKKRARRAYSKSLTTLTVENSLESPRAIATNEFTEEFYDNIEAFLDKEGVFIVSPTPTKALKSYLGLTKTHSQSIYETPEKTLDESLQYKDPDLDTKDQEFESLTMDKIKSEPVYSKGGSFLGKIAASSLLQKRKKFSTCEYLVPSKDHN